MLGRAANRAAISHVHDSRRNSQGAQAREAFQKNLLLVVGLLRREIFRRSKMRERAFQFDMVAIGQRCGEGLDFRRRNAQAVHAGIDFQVKRHAAGFSAASISRAEIWPRVRDGVRLPLA